MRPITALPAPGPAIRRRRGAAVAARRLALALLLAVCARGTGQQGAATPLLAGDGRGAATHSVGAAMAALPPPADTPTAPVQPTAEPALLGQALDTLSAAAGALANLADTVAAALTRDDNRDPAPRPAATAADAGLGPADLAVLVAEGDPLSEAVARAYQAARGVPEANIIRLSIPAGSDSLPATDFMRIKQLLDARLPGHIQATLVTWRQPSRVQGTCAMSLTSALAFGYDARWCGGCQRTWPSPYFDSSSRRPWADHRLRPSMMLGAATLAEAQALIGRGVAADGLLTRRGSEAVSGSGWLLRTSDGARSVRYPDFLRLAGTPVAGVTVRYLDSEAGASAQAITYQPDVMFYFTGLAKVPQPDSNRYLPGAVADHLTSFGGLLPEANGQMAATDWLAAGATGSFGTVEEPCNYTEKFPRASVLVGHYQRGETLIESYWKSVQWPGQGLFIGEPLARPWARL
jgi:uncharacterized protein (TIGR03790 family)